MQICHKAHTKTIERALTMSDKVIVLLGSNQARTFKNPFTWQEREEMIRVSSPDIDQKSITVAPIQDHPYNDTKWVQSVQETINVIVTSDSWKIDQQPSHVKIGLIGHNKDASSFYLKCFPQWDFIDMPNIGGLHSTDIRAELFGNMHVVTGLSIGVENFLHAFIETDTYDALRDEFKFIEKYKQQFSGLQYPPIFVTVDCVVVCSGHILLIQRRALPGKNLWALSGGFLNPDENLMDAAIRELREETRLKVPTPVLKGGLKGTMVADHPSRSLRGRTISHVFLFEIQLDGGKLPKIKGADDAKRARWVPLVEVKKMKDVMFEDHAYIIENMIEKL
jgi:bifunctional NMN adenylyltransferase/nudix hydrolase